MELFNVRFRVNSRYRPSKNELMREILDIAAEEYYAIGIVLACANGYGIRNVNMMQRTLMSSHPGWKYPHPAPTNVFTFYYSQ